VTNEDDDLLDHATLPPRVHEFRFRAACCWLSQEVEFLGWRLRLETLMPSVPSDPVPTSDGQGGQYAVHSM